MIKLKNFERKLEPEEAGAKIKILIANYFEAIGRNEDTDTDMSRINLIDDIEFVLDNTNISNKHLIAEKLDSDNKI